MAGGISRSNRANAVIVGFTLLTLVAFVGVGLPSALSGASRNLGGFFGGSGTSGDITGLLHASALMFVGYTGYGRIATLGGEVRDPRRSIPTAIIVTLAGTAVIYAAVAFVCRCIGRR